MSPEEKPPVCDCGVSGRDTKAPHALNCATRVAEEKPKATPMTAEELRKKLRQWWDDSELYRFLDSEDNGDRQSDAIDALLALITARDAARDAEMERLNTAHERFVAEHVGCSGRIAVSNLQCRIASLEAQVAAAEAELNQCCACREVQPNNWEWCARHQALESQVAEKDKEIERLKEKK